MKATPLPTVVGRFIGRHVELALIEDRFERERLVTLLGPPGIGKTRCALAFAASRKEHPSVFVDLAHARAEADLLSALGRALGVGTPKGGERLGELIALRERPLFIFDNAEHVAPLLAGQLGGWLAAAPDARFLVTSLIRLGLEEESCVELGGLEPEQALELYEERAGRAGVERPDPVWSPRLVARLEGVPLAIELAAARARILSPRQMLRRLEKGLDVLRGGTRQPRHRSMADSLKWSLELLDDEEAEALVQVSVFAGGFSLAAAEVLMGRGDTLELLERLRDKSFLRFEPEGEGRFGMLESLRLFAREMPGMAALLDRSQRSHAIYFIDRADEGVDGAPDAEQLAWLLAEEENLRVAHGYAKKPAALRARACLALAKLLSIRGPVEVEAERLEEGAAAARESGDAALVARLFRALSVVSMRKGELRAASRLLEEARRAAVASGQEGIELHVSIEAGRLRFAEGAWREARLVLDGMIELAQARGETFLQGYAFNLRGMAAEAEGLLSEAEADFEHALELFSLVDNQRYAAIAGLNLGVVQANLGRLDDAAGRFERAAETFRRIEDLARETDARLNLGSVYMHRGWLDEAEPLLQEGLAKERYIGNRRGEAIALDSLAKLAFEKEEFQRALEYSRACRELCRKGDLRHALALHLPFGAAIEAAMGNEREAEEDFREARLLAESAAGEVLQQTWAVLHELLRLSKGEDEDSIRARLASREARLDALRPGQRRSLLELALRWLRKGLESGAALPKPAQALCGEVLSIGPEGSWFCLGEAEPVDLTKRRAPRLLLRALADRRLATPGVGLSVENLAEVGWPGERGLPSARYARVYVAIHALRTLGLGEHLQRRDDGYLLDPALEVLRPGAGRN